MRPNKPAPCNLNPKHKWEFIKNVTLQDITHGVSGTQIKIRYRGWYKCACGERRIGQSQDIAKGGAA